MKPANVSQAYWDSIMATEVPVEVQTTPPTITCDCGHIRPAHHSHTLHPCQRRQQLAALRGAVVGLIGASHTRTAGLTGEKIIAIPLDVWEKFLQEAPWQDPTLHT